MMRSQGIQYRFVPAYVPVPAINQIPACIGSDATSADKHDSWDIASTLPGANGSPNKSVLASFEYTSQPAAIDADEVEPGSGISSKSVHRPVNADTVRLNGVSAGIHTDSQPITANKAYP